ncbi:scopoletin glucosyltransferase-like [Populus alba x Populus x berolinensis]|nr:scopoletin glucosyltransferase-like [Populus alba x Populus x berolinensis]
MAKLFASRGIKTTIITTPLNAPLFSKTIQKNKELGFDINILTIKFPAAEAGLPEGYENTDAFIFSEMTAKFIKATTLLQAPFEKVLQECHPDCIVADVLFPWATDAAAKFGIPRLVFHGISDIKLTKKQLPDYVRENAENDFSTFLKACKEAESRSFGVVVNSFYELEPAYADYYKKVLGRKAWNVGPVSLCNRDSEDKAGRGKETSIDQNSQLKEIAAGLEASGQQFIWVVKRNQKGQEDKEDWLPEGFEERMEGMGLIIRGWAPQVLILDHEAIGAFVTHCGWNSTLEGITAGKPMVTWPIFAEQFYNEKLVTEVLKTGVGVGVKEWLRMHGDHVKSEAVEKTITQIMVGEEAEETRSRAKKLGETARKAVEEGGSSYSDFNALIEELRRRRP